MRFWSSGPLAGEEGARALLDDIRRHFRARTLFQWGIARLDDDAIVGTTTIFHIDDEHRRGEIGFAIGRSHWGRGYASEAVTLRGVLRAVAQGVERRAVAGTLSGAHGET